MHIGIPKEIKNRERRVAMTPEHVCILGAAGHALRVQQGAGIGAGFADEAYRQAGAELVATAAEAWDAELVVKVKEPLPEEHAFLHPGLTLFTYLHLAA
ncbi:MAG TPA: alanine dehydrogenase, partial [Mariprofundaceae bacterium]|nr:alanine dehydrogenase [Mariprofundaceae bacterium]